MIFLSLQLSVGIGYAMSPNFEGSPDPLRGIVEIAQPIDDGISVGLLHSSRLSNGIKKSPDDQNIIYFKIDL